MLEPGVEGQEGYWHSNRKPAHPEASMRHSYISICPRKRGSPEREIIHKAVEVGMHSHVEAVSELSVRYSGVSNIEVNRRTVGTFRIVRYIVGVRC